MNDGIKGVFIFLAGFVLAAAIAGLVVADLDVADFAALPRYGHAHPPLDKRDALLCVG